MTSRSPKSRRTTAWRAIRRATATSLLAALGWGAPAAAQSTPPGWAGPGDRPAKTGWQPFPNHHLGATVPLASAAAPTPPPAPPGGVGSRVVVFTKPAGELQPVQAAQDPPKANGQDQPKVAAPPTDDKTVPIKPLAQREPDPARVFRLLSDDALLAERFPGRDKSILDYLPEIRDTDEQAYRNALARWEVDRQTEPNKPKPTRPDPLTSDELVVSLKGAAPAAPNVTKPGYAPAQAKLEPGYVVHRRLFFEEMNSERYGWELGMAQPFVSAAYFYKDVLLWPAHLTSNFKERFDTNAGKCLPGTPVAYYLYPPQITLTGLSWQTGAVLGIAFLLP